MEKEILLSENDAEFAFDFFKTYFYDCNRIDDYLRKIKIQQTPKTNLLPGYSMDDVFFNENMHPNDMSFYISFPTASTFMSYMREVTSHIVEDSIPGRGMFIFVNEQHTHKIVGMIRIGSTTINSKPRNIWLNQPLDTYDSNFMKRFNDASMMGFNIVPIQPFGYNYLGGKLLAAICCSHELREIVNNKYGSNLCYFETTSLYGSTKSISQYDGMEPYLRFIGLTDSNFIPILDKVAYHHIGNWFDQKIGKVVLKQGTSKKMKTQSRMMAIIKKSLPKHRIAEFDTFLNSLKNLNEQKRFYYSDYGFANVREYINGIDSELVPNRINFDKHHLKNIIAWWQKKASHRYEKLLTENRFRTKLELWSKDHDIQIIR